jgi:hypothetical protein
MIPMTDPAGSRAVATPDPVANIADALPGGGTRLKEAVQRRVGVRYPPLGARAARHIPVGIERELISADVEADVERLIEVRLGPQ